MNLIIILIIVFILMLVVVLAQENCGVDIQPLEIELDDTNSNQTLIIENLNNYNISFVAYFIDQKNRLSATEFLSLNIESGLIEKNLNISVSLTSDNFSRTRYSNLILKFNNCTEKIIPITIKTRITMKRLFNKVGMIEVYDRLKISSNFKKVKSYISGVFNKTLISDLRTPFNNKIDVKVWMIYLLFSPITLIVFFIASFNRFFKLLSFFVLNIIFVSIIRYIGVLL